MGVLRGPQAPAPLLYSAARGHVACKPHMSIRLLVLAPELLTSRRGCTEPYLAMIWTGTKAWNSCNLQILNLPCCLFQELVRYVVRVHSRTRPSSLASVYLSRQRHRSCQAYLWTDLARAAA